jgi:membrane protein
LVPPPLTDADKAYYTDAVRAETRRPELRLDIEYVSCDDAAALSTDTTRLD